MCTIHVGPSTLFYTEQTMTILAEDQSLLLSNLIRICLFRDEKANRYVLVGYWMLRMQKMTVNHVKALCAMSPIVSSR